MVDITQAIHTSTEEVRSNTTAMMDTSSMGMQKIAVSMIVLQGDRVSPMIPQCAGVS